MRKRMIALVLCGLVFFAGNTQAFAANIPTDEPIVVSPQMENILQVSASLSVDNTGNAQVTSYISGLCGITNRVKISAKLQKYVDGGWETVQTFTGEKDSWWMNLNDSCKVSKGYTYRVRSTVYAYSDSSSEIKTVTSNKVKY